MGILDFCFRLWKVFVSLILKNYRRFYSVFYGYWAELHSFLLHTISNIYQTHAKYFDVETGHDKPSLSSSTYLCCLVAKLCQTFCDPMDYLVHGILQAGIPEWVATSLLQGIFPTQESNPGLLCYRQILHQLSYQGSPQAVKYYV